MLHHTGPEGAFQMDIMFDNYDDKKYAWLLLINVNTRKLYEEQINARDNDEYIDGEGTHRKRGGKKSEDSVLRAIQMIIPKIQRNEMIIRIRADSEKAFYTNSIKTYLHEQGIEIYPVSKFDGHSSHTALAVIDRVIRTIRDRAAEMLVKEFNDVDTHDIQGAIEKVRDQGIGLTPESVPKLVDAYNN
jgi:hypothetical protein